MKTVINIQADEQVNRLMTWILEERGYEVINVHQPGDLAGPAAPDLIIINTNLSAGEKRACIEALRAIAPAVRIIDLSVGAEHPDYDTGADLYLSKPFDGDDLVSLVDEATGLSGSLRAPRCST